MSPQTETSHVVKHGRRFHGTDAVYDLPNDDDELDRLDFAHRAAALHMGGIHKKLPPAQQAFLEPRSDGRRTRVLDLGCGTGRWCVELATQYPHVDVVGVDLSPVQRGKVPPNCAFIQLDFLTYDIGKNSLLPEGHFDVVHWRYLMAGVQDFPFLIKRAARLLNPQGGLLLAAEPYNMLINVNSSAANNWHRQLKVALAARGLDRDVGHRLKALVEASGEFHNIDARVEEFPMGAWPEDPIGQRVGKLFHKCLLTLVSGFTPMLASSNQPGTTPEELDAQLKGVTSDFETGAAGKALWSVVYLSAVKAPRQAKIAGSVASSRLSTFLLDVSLGVAIGIVGWGLFSRYYYS